MSADGAEKEAVWNEVAAALTAEVEAGKQVGFITLGDAMLFSTWIFFYSSESAARSGWRLSPASRPSPR